MTRKCENCGALNPEEREYCYSCADPLNGPGEEVSPDAFADILERVDAMRAQLAREFWPEGDPAASREALRRLRAGGSPSPPSGD